MSASVSASQIPPQHSLEPGRDRCPPCRTRPARPAGALGSGKPPCSPRRSHPLLGLNLWKEKSLFLRNILPKTPPWVSGSVLGGDTALGGTGTPGVQEAELWPPLLLHTKDAHVVFALLLVLLNQVVKGVGKILEEHVLLVHLQAQDAVQEFGDGAVCKSTVGQGTWHSWTWNPPAPSQRAPQAAPPCPL